MSEYSLGIDIGGTFTDLVIHDHETAPGRSEGLGIVARDRVGRIDINKCRLFMLMGEYDHSCTVEISEATAAKIPGVQFQAMQGIGHFPFAENPKRFADYVLPILAELEG